MKDGEDIHHLSIARYIPKVRGSWRMFSAEMEAAGDNNRRAECAARHRPV